MDLWIILGAVAVLLLLILAGAWWLIRRDRRNDKAARAAELADELQPPYPDGSSYDAGDPMPWVSRVPPLDPPRRPTAPANRDRHTRSYRPTDVDGPTRDPAIYTEPYRRTDESVYTDSDSGRTGHVTHGGSDYTPSSGGSSDSGSSSGSSYGGGSSGGGYSGGSDSGSSGGSSGGDSGGGSF